MSEEVWDFKSEEEHSLREMITQRLTDVVINNLWAINPDWGVQHCDDVLTLEDVMDYVEDFDAKDPPLCLWNNSPRNALRYENKGCAGEFWHPVKRNVLEFCCIYHREPSVDYRMRLVKALVNEFRRFSGREAIVYERGSGAFPVSYYPNKEGDCSPKYWRRSNHIAIRGKNRFGNTADDAAVLEINQDFSSDCLVLQIALRLDRIVEESLDFGPMEKKGTIT